MFQVGLFNKKITIGLIISVFICLGFSVPILVIQQCYQLDQIPNVNLYPSSQMINQIVREFPRHQMATTYYTVNATSADVISYYNDRLDCRTYPDQRTTCQGNLNDMDNGEYSVYLPPITTQEIEDSSYAIEIYWTTCNWKLGFIE